MAEYRTRHPVAFLVFNRPETTREVFGRIAKARPARLFIISDGPREGVAEDAAKCREVRSIVASIDWDCEVSTDHATENLGCRRRVSSGLSWVFSQTESAIILEDDCAPSPSFFRYCDELLEKYRHEPKVMMISGTNLLRESAAAGDYLFTMHGICWGWATWKRAWSTYDVDLSSWPETKQTDPFRALPFHETELDSFKKALDNLCGKDPREWKHNTWDYQWDYNRYIHKGLAITPKRNLVANIGFGSGATHTHDKNHKLANIPTTTLDFPLEHPTSIELSREYEERYYREIVRKTLHRRVGNFFRRAKRFLRKVVAPSARSREMTDAARRAG